MDPQDTDVGKRLFFYTKSFPTFSQALRAALVGRKIRPDIWWYATNVDNVWKVVGYHLSIENVVAHSNS